MDLPPAPGTPGGPVLVHLVPHSHDDVGWLTTIEKYFYTKTVFNSGSVYLIITTTVAALLDDPNRTFT